MSRLHINEDLFSPVRQDSSETDESEDSEHSGGILNFNLINSFKHSLKNKHVSEQSEIRCKREVNELNPISGDQDSALRKLESLNACTPAKKKSSDLKRTSKSLASDFNKLKLEKEKGLKEINVTKKEIVSKHAENHRNKRESKHRKNTTDNKVKESNSASDIGKHSSRPTSLLLSKKEVAKGCSSKDTKKEKSINQFSKNDCNVEDAQKPNAKHFEKMFIDNSQGSDSVRVKNFEVCSKSTDLYSSSSYDSSNKETYTMNQAAENSKSGSSSVYSQFELSVEKIVHDYISSECDKIRQNVCAQQMSFYRELNKLKGEMEKQHLETTERMFKVVEEMMQLNFALKSRSHLK